MLGGGVAFFPAEGCANLRQRGQRRGLARCNHFGGLGEIVPNERFHVWLDDDVCLRAPCQIGVTLHNRERPAQNIRERARLFEVARLKIYGDNNVCAEK